MFVLQNAFYSLFNSFGLMIGLIIFCFTLIISTIISGIPLYIMAKDAGLKNPWIAFVPILQMKIVYNLANLSGWIFVGLIFFLILFGYNSIISYLIVIMKMYCDYIICKNYKLNIIWFFISLLFGGLITYIYIIFMKIPFVGILNSKYTIK